MNALRENPVARHAARLAGRSARPWVVALLFLAAAALGLLLQRVWLGLETHSFLRPAATARWLGLTLLAETAVLLPWAAARGALLWRRLDRDGHLDEYRRSRLSSGAIVRGAAAAAVSPALLFLLLSLGAALGVSRVRPGLTAVEVIAAHGLLAAQCLAFAALGLWLAARLRLAAAAIPAALALLAAAVGAIWAVDPFLRGLPRPEGWIYWALLPNPVTAVGAALNTDVLRFHWIYQQLGAHEYFFVYPPAWQTAGLYLAAAGLSLVALTRRVAAGESRPARAP